LDVEEPEEADDDQEEDESEVAEDDEDAENGLAWPICSSGIWILLAGINS